MLRYAVLGSGSSGNSYVFSDGSFSLLIDQGYSVAELGRRLARFSIDLCSIGAVCVTHLHPDHAKGVGTLTRKLGIPAYFHNKALEMESLQVNKLGIKADLIRSVTPFEQIQIGPFSLFCFETSHDSGGSVGWCLHYQDQQVMVLTDTGITTAEQSMLAKDATILFLEANYDQTLLANGPYPAFLKHRIAGALGHLSNDQALEFLQESRFEGNHVYFIHLSDCNNDPELLEQQAKAVLQVPFTVCHKNKGYGPVWEAQ